MVALVYCSGPSPDPNPVQSSATFTVSLNKAVTLLACPE